MSLDSAISQGRVAAEARMSDACAITGAVVSVWNPSTEVYDETATPVYTGACRVKMPNAMSLEPDAGDTTRVVIRPQIHIPADILGVEVGNTVTVTATEFNPSLAGCVFRVTSLFRDSQATAQRLDCTEVQ